MTVTSATNRWQYIADGVADEFTFTNKIFEKADLEVYLDGTLQTLITAYDVSGLNSQFGGTVTFVSPPAANSDVLIVRNVQDLQETDYPIGGPFPADQVEDDFDRRTIITQQLRELVTRSLILAQSDITAVTTILPTAAAGNVIGWNQAGEAITQFDGTETDVVFINNVKDQIVAEAQSILDRFLAITQNVTISTAFPSGGNDGDIWLKVPA